MNLGYRILLTALLCMLGGLHLLQAQQYLYKAKVRLVNRDVVHGYLMEHWEQGTMHLQLSPNSYMKIEPQDIRRVKLVNSADQAVTRFKNKGLLQRDVSSSDFSLKKDYYHQLILGLGFGEEHTNASFGIINGYWFGKRISIGMGVNYDRYERMAVLPIYIQPRVYLKHDKTSLYYFTDVGYGKGWMNKNRNNDYEEIKGFGGFMGQAGVGYQLNFAKSALSFTLGYKLQQTKIHAEYFSYPYDPWGNWENTERQKVADLQERRINRRIAFTIGLTI